MRTGPNPDPTDPIRHIRYSVTRDWWRLLILKRSDKFHFQWSTFGPKNSWKTSCPQRRFLEGWFWVEPFKSTHSVKWLANDSYDKNPISVWTRMLPDCLIRWLMTHFIIPTTKHLQRPSQEAHCWGKLNCLTLKLAAAFYMLPLCISFVTELSWITW